MDPRPVWRELRKACRKQLRGLSQLRDAQVMAEWIEKLRLDRAPEGAILVRSLRKERNHGERAAHTSLKSFPRKRWKRWSSELPEAAGSLSVGGSRLALIALDRVEEVCASERQWRRTRSAAAWHKLRLAVKRLRYAVESFLPAQQAEWGRDLRGVQKMLGEGHDLDVLRARILKWARDGEASDEARTHWLEKIAAARDARTAGYMRVVAKSSGRRSGRAQSVGSGARKRKAPSIYKQWREELERLAKVSPAGAAKRAKSAANSGWRAAERSPRYPGKRLRLSSAP